jgi:hypothetical protein
MAIVDCVKPTSLERVTLIGSYGREGKSHYYRRPFGYPIRTCTWTIPGRGRFKEANEVTCKRCLQIQTGRRQERLMGETSKVVAVEQEPPSG